MDNQHRKINGYRELSPTEIALMNLVKEKAEEVGALLEEMSHDPGLDQRAVEKARTELQTGFMWAVRAIAQPTTF